MKKYGVRQKASVFAACKAALALLLALPSLTLNVSAGDDLPRREPRHRSPGSITSLNAGAPQVVRVRATPERLAALARAEGFQYYVWQSDSDTTVAALPRGLAARLRENEVGVEILFDSIADWQGAVKRGDRQARSISPPYQPIGARPAGQLRIAVIDLARRTRPAAGFSDWLGDRENVLLENDSYLAYCEVYSGDESTAAVTRHVEMAYQKRGYPVAGYFTPAEFERVVQQYFPGERYDAGRSTAAEAALSIQPALADGRFHSYDETLAEFNELAADHPELARMVTLGQSYEGRQIFGLLITQNPNVDDTNKPDVLITGCYHAREWISVEPPVYFANRLLRDYDSDDSVRYLVDSLQIWIVPIVNPDGLTYSQGSPNESQDSVRYWRKNRRPVTTDECGSAVGVDLNRNFAFQWRVQDDLPCPSYGDDIGASDNPENEIYRGPQPESEAEVLAIKGLLDDPKRKFRAQIDYHNYSQLILYPWGYQTFAAPDSDNLSWLASRLANEIFRVDRRTYRAEQAVELYTTTGSSIDYAYGARQVAAPFAIELRPISGRFNVSESDIDPICRENWAGARVLMDWAAGPPILRSVKAYQQSSDGTFSKLVYSARWTDGGGARELVIDKRFPAIEPGTLRVVAQFSKPMDAAAAPRVTLGRNDRTDELTLTAGYADLGWQRTVYANDTWVGLVEIVEDGDQTSPWRLAASALDPQANRIDALPATVAHYAIGTNKWSHYEDSRGEGREGGEDLSHVLSPTRRGDALAILVGSPRARERFAARDTVTVWWTLPASSAFLAVEQELWFSPDGGTSYEQLRTGIPGNADRIQVTLPSQPTTRGRFRIQAREGGFGNTLFGDSDGEFTIAAKISTAVRFEVVSSELVEQNWIDLPSEFSAGSSGTTQLVINLRLTNASATAVASPFLRVAELQRGHVLLSRSALSPPNTNAQQTVGSGDEFVLAPGDAVQLQLVIGLTSRKKFRLTIDPYGVPGTGAITAGEPIQVWKGKPRTE